MTGIDCNTKKTRILPAAAPAKAACAPEAIPPAPAKKDSVSLSQAAREKMLHLKAASKDMIHADLDHGLHVQLRGFGQELKLSIDRNGFHNEVHVFHLGGELHTDLQGVAVHANHGHSEAGVGVTTDGATAMVDTLGLRLEGGVGVQGITGEAKSSKNGIAVPVSLTGGEVLLKDDGDVLVDAYGVKAGVNVMDGSGAHAGYHRFGVGVDVSTESGVDAHIGSMKLGN